MRAAATSISIGTAASTVTKALAVTKAWVGIPTLLEARASAETKASRGKAEVSVTRASKARVKDTETRASKDREATSRT